MASKWYRGHLGRFWSHDDYRNFTYVKQPLMEKEIQEWKNKGYDYVKSFSGSMYDNRNPMPEWVERFNSIFDFKNLTFNFYKMSQLEIMPEHVDHFQTYMRLFNVEYKNIKRILVMLDDWKPGHYLEIDGVGIVNWIAGDYFVWDSDVKHAASNIGTEDRYTLQITGTKIQSADVYNNLHWYNFPDLQTKKESLYSPEMSVMKSRMNKENPYYIYMLNGEIKDLKSINHEQSTINYLNQIGLDIYLYEPLCSYTKETQKFYLPDGAKHTLLFYSEFHHKTTVNTQQLRSDELNSILEYVLRNHLTNVTVYTCDYNLQEYYTYYNSHLKLKCSDLFIEHFDLNEFEPIFEHDKTNDFSKKIICMNWRYAPHRQLVAAYLANINDVYMTWYYKADLGNVSSEPWYNIGDWEVKNPDVYNKMITGFRDLNFKSPINIDLEIKEPTAITDKYFKNMFPASVIFDMKKQKYGDNKDRLKTVYSDVFCDVVTESRFAQPTANFSEKVYRPMFYKKPFIMVGPPYTLKYMREHGFKTFSDFWDESYDTIENHESRLFAIFKLIDKINSLTISELKSLYEQMYPILKHNRNILLEKCLPINITTKG